MVHDPMKSCKSAQNGFRAPRRWRSATNRTLPIRRLGTRCLSAAFCAVLSLPLTAVSPLTAVPVPSISSSAPFLHFESSDASLAHAAIAERIVAVVGQHAILLSDLKQRCMPFLLRIYQSVPDGPARAANVSQVYQYVLDQMINEELEAQAARKAGVEITSEQIDAAIEQTAAQNGLTANEILVEAKRTGLSVQSYREELRRQLIQRAMMEYRMRNRVNVGESDLRQTYRRLSLEERMQQTQRTLALHLPAGRTDEEVQRSREQAEALATRARAGEDFRQLIAEHAKGSQSGLRPPLPPMQEPDLVQRATMALEVGEVSEPVRMGGDWVLFQVIERPPSDLPPYNEARAQIHERVYLEKLNTARQNWLRGLRRRTHVEVRL